MRKKLSLLFLLLCLLVPLVGCSDNQEHEGGVNITVSGEILDYLVYHGNLPSRKFEYDGVVSVAEQSTPSYYIFAGNDQYKFSDNFARHLESIKEQSYITVSNDCTADDKEAIFDGKKLPIDEPNRYSKEIIMVSWDSTGARYSYQYRTFTSEGKTYYSFWYTTNITISIEMPLLVKKIDGKNKLFLLSLPYDTKYNVGSAIELKRLVKGDTYLDEKYYKFAYPSYLESKGIVTAEAKQNAIIDWYKTYCNLEAYGNDYTFTYLGIKYLLVFDDPNVGFSISLLEY